MRNHKIVATNFIKQVFLAVFTLTHPRPPIQNNLPFHLPKIFIMLPYLFYFRERVDPLATTYPPTIYNFAQKRRVYFYPHENDENKLVEKKQISFQTQQ